MNLTPVAVAELAARKIEIANEGLGPIYQDTARRIAHQMRCLNDSEADQAAHRILIAAAHWRSFRGPVDTTAPGEWDPALRQEFESIEELKAAVDAFDVLANLQREVTR